MAEFRMPALGADMTEGTVTRWRVRPGDAVKRGDIAVEIETDKAEMEVEIFEAGVIERILVAEGEKVPVGTPLAIVASGFVEANAPVASARVPAPVILPPVAPPATQPAHVRVTPAAAALARQLGVDTAKLTGTGVAGSVTRRDVERAAARAPAPAPAPAEPVPHTGVRASPRARRLARERGIDIEAVSGTGPSGAVRGSDLEVGRQPPAREPEPASIVEPTPAPRRVGRGPIAALMARSNAEIPHYFLTLDIDMTATLGWMEERNRKQPLEGRVLPAALLLRAVALAAVEVPDINGHWVGDAFQPSTAVHLGVAISLREGGLVAPAILDAERRSLPELMADLRDLVLRARLGRLRASEMSMGTITVTNLGEQGVDAVHGVIYPPQVALVGFGRISERPWAEDGMLGVRRVVTATLAADHRASDGHRGGLFLSAVARRLQNPEQL